MKTTLSRLKFIVISAFVIVSTTAHALNSGVTYQGRILKPDGTPLAGQFTQFKMQLRTPDAGSCLMYEELQSKDLRNLNGMFSVTMSDGSGSRTDATALNLDKIFANHGSFAFNPATCASGTGSYTPNPSDGRDLVVLFKDETMAVWEPVPTQKINFVPFAFEAKQVAGFTSGSLVRVAEADGTLDFVSPLSNANYTELLALINGTTSQYSKSNQLNGVTMPSMNSGEVLGWNGAAWVSTSPVPGANTITNAMLQSNSVGTSQIANNVTIATSGTLTSAITTTRDFKIFATSPSVFSIDMQAPALTASYSLVWPLNAGAPTQVLTTDGAGNLSWAAPASSSQWTTTGANVYYNTGYVGIGTTTPFRPLTVGGSMVSSSGPITAMVNADGGLGGATFGSDSNHPVMFMSNSTEKMRLTPGGNVGIGTTAPTAKLHLPAGTAAAGTAPLKFTSGTNLGTAEDGAMEYASSSLYFTIGATRYVIPTNTAAGNFSNVTTISNAGGSITMSPLAGNSVIVNSATVSTTPTSGALIVSGGAGISGDVNTTGNIKASGSATFASQTIGVGLVGAPSLNFTGDLATGIYHAGAGVVGISSAGTDYLDIGGGNGVSVNAQLQVAGGINEYASNGTVYTPSSVVNVTPNASLKAGAIRVMNTAGGVDGVGAYYLSNSSNSSGLYQSAYFGSVSNAGPTAYTPTIVIGQQTGASSYAERMRIDSLGNVGVGTTSPSASLDVNGEVKPGNTGIACSAANQGAIRFNTVSKVLEYCNSTAWTLVQASACTNATPGAFAFTAQPNATISTLYSSNIVQITGINCSVTTTISGPGSPSYQICSDAGCGTVLQSWTTGPSSISNNQYIQIKQTSSGTGGVTNTATMIVGGGASVYQVTSTGSCASSPAIGTVCADGSVYAGLSPDGNVPMYAQRCDIGMTWNGATCTGARSGITWNNGSGNFVALGIQTVNTGRANTAVMFAAADAGAAYQPAVICRNLNEDGHTDWYVPAYGEAAVMSANQASIANFDPTYGPLYQTSTETNSAQYAFGYRMFDGYNNWNAKNSGSYLRCVRR